MTNPRCWAFNQEGARCELDAGHDRNHSIITSWTDAECASPIIHQLPTPSAPAPLVTDMSPKPVQPTKCAACNHAHRDGECRCGCYSYIG